jgi:hypothetical protein
MAQNLKKAGQLPVTKISGAIESLINDGNLDSALAVIYLMGSPQPDLLLRVAEAFMKAHRPAEAGTAAAEALGYFRQSDIHQLAETYKVEKLGTLMQILAKAGKLADFQQAATLALAASSSEGFAAHQSENFGEVSKAYAAAHLYRQARLTADRCADASDQLSAYAAILREYVIQTRPDRSNLFVDE